MLGTSQDFLSDAKINPEWIEKQMLEKSRLHLLAPLSGSVLPIEQVPDPVFGQKLVGDGIAIDPTSQSLVAPCAGRVVQLHPANHAISIQSDEGVHVLLHIGLDTVKLKGLGFTPRVKLGDRVEAGQTLIEFDADLIAQKAKSLISIMALADAPDCELSISPLGTAQSGKDVILEIGFLGAKATQLKATPTAKKAESELLHIHLPTGLHARPAALLVGIAKKYEAKVDLQKNGNSANAKSVVGILGLEIVHGDHVKFVAEGSDANAAVAELAKFLKELDEHPTTPAPAPAPVRVVTLARPAHANVIVGVAASPGVAVGRVHQVREQSFAIVEMAADIKSDSKVEKTRLAKALKQADEELKELQLKVKADADAGKAAIFAAHQELLQDPDLIELATGLLDQKKTAAFAWNQAITVHADRLAQLNNELMANRANDLRDVGRRVLRILFDSKSSAPSVAFEAILVAENLTPSDTVQLDREKVLGFCTTTGGATSHVAILARSLGLPAIAGIEARALEIPDGTEIILDGDRGEIRLNPTAAEKEAILEQQRKFAEKRRVALSSATKPATTIDGHQMIVAANIGGVADAQKAVEMGCDGVGLLRSEFLFLERTVAPSEEEQFRVYQEIADILGPRPLVIRTLDVGGDKPLQYLPIPAEENPFLGERGIRVCLNHPEILREQLRAILRVKTQGEMHIMFPMVSLLEEWRMAKAILEEERVKLGVPPVQAGIMIEVPSAALLAEAFAPEVDFFSIGTNDLTQYTMAMDRGHKALAKLVDGLHPSVLRLIDITVKAAHRHGKWVGVCGGIASDPKAVEVLLGLGVDELSVSLPVIPLVKSQLREAKFAEAQGLAQKALTVFSGKEVRELTTEI